MIQDYVAIDLETTGLDAKRDRIIEVGAIRVRDGVTEEIFHSMVNPRRRLNPQIQELTGIRDEMVIQAPEIGDIIAGIVNFCEGLPLLGHHVIFDYSFLKRAAVNRGIAFEKDGIDTLKLCLRRCMCKNMVHGCFHSCLSSHADSHKYISNLCDR